MDPDGPHFSRYYAPELKMSDDVQEFITALQIKVREASWKQMAVSNRKVKGARTNPRAQMDSLARRFGEQEKG